MREIKTRVPVARQPAEIQLGRLDEQRRAGKKEMHHLKNLLDVMKEKDDALVAKKENIKESLKRKKKEDDIKSVLIKFVGTDDKGIANLGETAKLFLKAGKDGIDMRNSCAEFFKGKLKVLL